MYNRQIISPHTYQFNKLTPRYIFPGGHSMKSYKNQGWGEYQIYEYKYEYL